MKLSRLLLIPLLSLSYAVAGVSEGAYAQGTPASPEVGGKSAEAKAPAATSSASKGGTSGVGTMGGGATTVTVTENVPGANCSLSGGSGTNSRYKCTVGKGFSSVMGMLSGIVKYGTFLITLIGILMIVASGVQISMGGIDASMREDAKTRITHVLTGLAFLFLVSMILNTVAPWVYR
jgi:hypothetical protein